MIDFGTVKPGTTLYIPFATYDSNDPTASVTMTGLAVTDIEIYSNGGTTQRASDSGYTLLDTDGTDFDGLTGIHGISVNLADNTTAGFYAAGNQYWVVLSSVTVDAGTISGILATFRIGYPEAIINTTIATLASQTSFTLTAGPAEDDALNGMWCIIHDVASAVQLGRAIISDYVGSTLTVTLSAATTFTAAVTDNISIMGLAPIQPTVAGRTLDVTATGGAGVDWANVENQSTSVNLSATTTNLCNTITTYTGNTVQTGDNYARLDEIMDDGTAVFDRTTDSLQAIRDRGDAAWITGGGGGLTQSVNPILAVPPVIDLANTASVRIGIILTNTLDDLPTTAEITPGTITIARKAQGGTTWSNVVAAAAMSEQDGFVYYDEVFDTGTGYAVGDMIRIQFESVSITADSNTYNITGATGVYVYSYIIEPMRGTDSAALASVCTEARLAELDAANLPATTDNIETDTQDIQSRLPAALVGGRIDANTGAISGDATAADRLEAWLDTFVTATLTAGSTTTGTLPTATYGDLEGSLFAVISGTGSGQSTTVASFNDTTDVITFVDTLTTALDNTSVVIVIPFGRSIIDTSNPIDANIVQVGGVAEDLPTATALATVDTNVDAILVDTNELQTDWVNGGRLDLLIDQIITDIAALNNLSAAQVNAEVVDALATDTYAELSAVPAATSTLADKINWLFVLARNRMQQTATTQTLRNDADSLTIATSTHSDSAGTYTRGEWT